MRKWMPLLVVCLLVLCVMPGYASNVVWPSNRIMEIQITLSKGDWADMRANALDETAYPATVVIDGEKIETVGFHTKGNATLVNNVKTGQEKLPFKLDFAEYYPGNYHGIEVINLNNEYLNPSYMHEAIGYDVFDMMGVPTPSRAYAKVYVNGEYRGLYLAIENIGTGFVTRYYGSAVGELYKPDGKGSNMEWRGSQSSQYKAFAAKTPAAKGHVLLRDMVEVLNHTQDTTQLDKVLNIESAIAYLAVNAALVNYDSYLASNPHNYYLYEVEGRFEILPWDLQMAFGMKKIKKYTDVPLTDLYIDDPTDQKLNEKVLFNKLMEHPQYHALYHQYLRQIAQQVLTEDAIAQKIARYDALIAREVQNDPFALYGPQAYEQGKVDLQDFAAKRGKSVLKQLDGTQSAMPPEGTYTDADFDQKQDIKQSDKGDLGKAIGKMFESLWQDIMGIVNAFRGEPVLPEKIDAEQLEDDMDVIQERISHQEAVFRYNLYLGGAVTAAIIVFCLVLAKKRRI